MFKNLKMGLKLGLGFGLVILLVGLVGGISIVNMFQIRSESMKLKDEYVPEVSIVNGVERSSLLTMYAMRGYALSFDDAYLKSAEEELVRVFSHLADAKAHAEKYPDLTSLKTGTATALAEAEKYRSLAEDTQEEIARIQEYRSQADEVAGTFMDNCIAYLDSQNKAMMEEIREEAGRTALERRLTKVTLINDIIDGGNNLRIANFKGQLLNDASLMERALKEFETVMATLDQIEGLTLLKANLEQLSKIEDSGNKYSEAMVSIIDSYEKLAALNVDRGEAADEVLSASKDVALKGIEATQSIAQGALVRIQASVTVILIGVVISLAIAVVVAVFLTRVITSALNMGVDFAKELSEGNLNADLKVVQKDELGILAEALRNMRDKLSEIVGAVSSGSEQIASASEQLAYGNQDLSNRTEQQASALEETSAAIEEMNSSIKSNADNTQTADQLSRDAVVKAEEGTKTISTMVSSMDDINVSSGRIADIIEVITNIAFQTNLLALNASIEAARAGEQGKGFAVVAVEVRKLAKRSDNAAKEITEIIKSSNQKVSEGVEIANQAGVVLNEINNSIKKVTTLVAEISAASQEQLSSAEQINQTLNSLDENTQKNAALVEEAASATEELSAQAQELNSTMQFFKHDGRYGNKGEGDTPARDKASPKKKVPVLEAPGPGKSGETKESSYTLEEGEFDEF